MHEMSIAMSIVEIAETYAREENASKILKITLDLGEHSGAVAESVEFCFDACSRGTMAEGSLLEINRIKAEALCAGCGETFHPKTTIFICPKCGDIGANLVAGEELQVRNMEVE